MKVDELLEARDHPAVRHNPPDKWWIVTSEEDGKPCGRIEAPTRVIAQRKAGHHWSPKKVIVKQQKPEPTGKRSDEKVYETKAGVAVAQSKKTQKKLRASGHMEEPGHYHKKGEDWESTKVIKPKK